jgi:hypothetical protein
VSLAEAETVAAFLVERVRAARGPLWDEGPSRLGVTLPPPGPGLAVLATRRVRGIPEPVARGLFAWAHGARPAELLFTIPTAREVLARQAEGRRCVSVLDDAAARAHGDPRHPDGLTFVLHDLCHLEKFVEPAHHRGQVGFFRCVARALAHPGVAALEAGFDDRWRADRDYVISDMNGSAIFLFAALKMKVNMAVRRRLGGLMGGPLRDHERAALGPALGTLFEAMGLPEAVRPDAFAVSTRRDHPEAAARLLAHFEGEGAASPGELSRAGSPWTP